MVSPPHLDDPAALHPGSPRSYDAASIAKSRLLGAGLRQLAERQGAVFVDAAEVAVVGSDGVHLSLDSHRPLAELLAMAIRALPRPGQSEEEALAAKVQ